MAVEFVDVSDIHLRDIRFHITRADGRVLDFSDVVSEFSWSDDVNTAGAEVNVNAVGEVADILKIGGEGSSCRVTAPLVDLDSGKLVRRELWQGVFEDVVDDRSEGQIVRFMTGFDIAKALTYHDEDYVFQNSTLSAIVRQIAGDFSIPLGEVPTTSRTLGQFVHRGRGLWEIIQEAVQRHADLTGEVYYVYATGGRLNMRLQGDQSRYWVFEYGESIQNVRRTRSIRDLINRVKIYGVFQGEAEKPSVESVKENLESQALYGLRQRVEYLPGADDESKVIAMAEKVLSRYAVPDEEIEITGWLVPNLRSGEQIRFVDPEWGINRLYYVESIDTLWSTQRAETVARCRRDTIDTGQILDEVTVA